MNSSRGLPGSASLPVELTHFVGRTDELNALGQLLESTRLLTLTGPGGTGKSRLALRLVSQFAPRDGIAWVELAPLEDASLIPGAVLRALGTPTEGGSASNNTVVESIGARAALLVLDNCEHLIDACAALADTLLRACPALRILATSREALGIAGERAWLVPPLAVPDPDANLAALETSDSVRLFVDRAADVVPHFTLTARNAPAIAAICARLDGIPLAIELAASRARHLSPEQIRDRLTDAFSLLTTGARTALPRHRTLRATLDWSHDLLPEAARVVFRRLAVFRGGFTLDAAEHVAAGGEIAAGDVLDLVSLLVDRSMVVVREQRGAPRFQLLETVRQYATLRLQQSGEETEVRRLFAAEITAVVAGLEPAFLTRERRAAFETLEPELDNLREALHWTHEFDRRQHVHLVGLLWWFWFSTRHWVEAHRRLTEALALPEALEKNRDRAALLFAIGALAALRAHVDEARPLLDEAIDLARSVGDEQLRAYALSYQSMVYGQQLRVEAIDYAARAEAWFRAHDDAYGLRLALLLGGLAVHAAGDSARALAMLEEAVAIARSFRQDRELAIALQTHATVLLDRGELAAAEAALRECLAALRRDPAYIFICRGIDYLVLTMAARAPRDAAKWIGASDSVRRHIGASRFGSDQRRVEPVLATLQATLGEQEYRRAWEEGSAIAPGEVLDRLLGPEIETESNQSTPALVADRPEQGTGATADLEVRALGPFEVVVRGQPIESWPYARPKELLAYLLSHPAGRTRAEIGAALWPDAAPAQVRNNFHVTIHHLRKALGHAGWIVVERERYRIASDIVVDYDVERFERTIGSDAVQPLTEALALYRDHFLSGESAGSWRDDEQDRLRHRASDAGVRLAALLEKSGDLPGAIRAYEEVIGHEPLHEPAHRGLVSALARNGDRNRALRHYERYASRLRAELDSEPEPELETLYRAIRREGN